MFDCMTLFEITVQWLTVGHTKSRGRRGGVGHSNEVWGSINWPEKLEIKVIGKIGDKEYCIFVFLL